MIELRDITIANDPDRPLVAHQSLSIPAGSLTALIGRNGCGKSTLLRIISGTQKPLSGSVIVNGIDIAKASARHIADTIAVVTTEIVRIPNLTCRELVAYGRSPHTGLLGRLSADDEAIVDRSLRAAGMENFASRRLTQLSDGESRRIMLASAMAQQTPVILLDEPTSFLDVPGRYEICAMLGRMAREQGKTIVYSTHELEPAFQQADNILLMHSDGFLFRPPELMRGDSSFASLFAYRTNS